MAEHDDDLRDPRLTALYHRKDGEQPPAHLDATIRAAARKAVKRSAKRRWWPSLATAAVLVLGVGVALKVFEQPVPERAEFDRPSRERRDPAPAPRERTQMSARPAADREALGKASPASPVRSYAAEPAAGSAQRGPVDADRVAAPGPVPAEIGEPAGPAQRAAAPPADCRAYRELERMNEVELRTALEAARRREDPTAVHCLERALQERQRSPSR